jgi:IS30 family transposase
MGTKFSHLSQAERWAIETKLREGLSYAAIGIALWRNRSTIFHEARRGRRKPVDRYLAEFGRRYCLRKRAQAGLARRKLDAQMLKPAWKTVLFGLQQEWSPQQLCDQLH